VRGYNGSRRTDSTATRALGVGDGPLEHATGKVDTIRLGVRELGRGAAPARADSIRSKRLEEVGVVHKGVPQSFDGRVFGRDQNVQDTLLTNVDKGASIWLWTN